MSTWPPPPPLPPRIIACRYGGYHVDNPGGPCCETVNDAIAYRDAPTRYQERQAP